MIEKILGGKSKEFVKTSLLSGLSTVVRVVIGFVSNKVASIYLGPAGFALLGQFNNFSAIVLGFSTGGIGTGVSKYVAEYHDDKARQERIVRSAVFVMTISSVIVGLSIVLFAGTLSGYLLHDDAYSGIFVVFGFLTIFSALTYLITSLFVGFKKIVELTVLTIILAFVTLIILVPLVMMYGLYGALIAGIVTIPVGFLISLRVLKTTGFEYRRMIPRLEREGFLKLLGYSAMTFTTALASPISQIMVRNEIASSISLESAGYWQGMIRISDTYLAVITTSLAYYYLPRLSELQAHDDLRREVFLGYKILIPLMLLLTLSMYFLRSVAIHLFFTPNFSPMQVLFPFQLMGDFFRIASWILSYLMVAKAMTGRYVLTEILFAGVFVAASFSFLRLFGLVGVSYAHAMCYFLYLVTMVIMFRKLILRRAVSIA